MSRLLALLATLLFPLIGWSAQPESCHVLAFYSTKVEADHVDFANQALVFFRELSVKDHFDFDTTTNWNDLNRANLAHYQVVLWLNDAPTTPAERADFEWYMQHGGAWLGFHAAGYNDSSTRWPWFVKFLGGAVFNTNSWPPLPARLAVEPGNSPITAGLGRSFESPANEWYIWEPDPRANKSVKVLLTLEPSNYPLGLKDTLLGGDLPVVWTNTDYRMLYMNMGHGNKIFTSSAQNLLFRNAILWLGQTK